MRLFVLLSFLLPLAAQEETAKKPNPAIGNPQAIEAGRKLFANSCALCHGADGRGGRGPNLLQRGAWHPMDDDELFKTIQKGIPGGDMPPINQPDEQLWQMVAYVRSLTSPAFENPAPGDPASGEALFWGKGACGGCHMILGRGGMLGPDLSNVGGTQALGQIREAILDPDADGAPTYRGVKIVDKRGRTIEGVARNRTNYSLQVQDAQGNLHLLSMADVREMTLSAGSPMPKDYKSKLSSQELDDLLAYLSRRSVRPREEKK
jgi:putative heme-binding domain-containing protein